MSFALPIQMTGAPSRFASPLPGNTQPFIDSAIYARVVDASHAFDLDPDLVDELSGALPHAMVVNACTTKRVITTVETRTVLGQRFNAAGRLTSQRIGCFRLASLLGGPIAGRLSKHFPFFVSMGAASFLHLILVPLYIVGLPEEPGIPRIDLADDVIATVRRWLQESSRVAPDKSAQRLAGVLRDPVGLEHGKADTVSAEVAFEDIAYRLDGIDLSLPAPHGKAVLLRLPLSEIGRRFGRPDR